jgi:hypothetical protein
MRIAEQIVQVPDGFVFGLKVPDTITTKTLLGHSPPGEAFWPSGTAGGQPASGAQIGFWVIRLLLAASVQKRTTDEHKWTQILKAGFGISFAFLRVTIR